MMKAIRLHEEYRGEATVTVIPVATVARANGITRFQVPALLAAWFEMGAIVPRKDGGYDVVRHVPAGDPEALRLVTQKPWAAAPRWAPFNRNTLLGIGGPS